MVLPPKHPKMIIFSRKTTILGNPHMQPSLNKWICRFLFLLYADTSNERNSLRETKSLLMNWAPKTGPWCELDSQPARSPIKSANHRTSASPVLPNTLHNNDNRCILSSQNFEKNNNIFSFRSQYSWIIDIKNDQIANVQKFQHQF